MIGNSTIAPSQHVQASPQVDFKAYLYVGKDGEEVEAIALSLVTHEEFILLWKLKKEMYDSSIIINLTLC